MTNSWQTEPHNVQAVCRFAAGPGREQEAAEAWAFELTYYFARGIGEPPRVEYKDGVYICTGLMTTTHPEEHGPVSEFDKDSPAWDLDFALNPQRQKRLREQYPKRGMWWDGRDHGEATPAEQLESMRVRTAYDPDPEVRKG